jgi:soluble lytic murein transglycosylase-like protein
MSLQPPADLRSLAHAAARVHALPPELVCAVIEQESGWDRWAMRYEPAFYQRYIEPLLAGPTPLARTEARARAFSWGLMQVIGQVAREHGFAGNSLAQLCEPSAGIEIGCRVLASKLAAAGGNVPRALLLWNGGANPGYPDAVLNRVRNYAAS